ncbi:MAG: glycosyltransferase family 4 protein [Bacteroidota bacterium]
MTILFASNHIGVSATGGLSIQATKTAEHLQKAGVNIIFHNAWEEINAHSIDAVHIFGAGIGTYHFAREIFRKKIPLFLSPVFFSLHTSSKLQLAIAAQHTFRKVMKGTWTDIGIVAEMCNWATGIFPNTNEEAKLLVEGLKADTKKICVVPNGVDEQFATVSPELFVKEYGWENFILNVGYFGERKNTLMFLQAVNALKLPAVIIGRSSNDEYSLLCKKELAKGNILHIEQLPNTTPLLASAYAAASVFCLPSLYETPGISALEAGLTGTPIAITQYGGTKEYFLNYAEYIDPDSRASIESAIHNAQQKGRNVQLTAHIRNNYLWSNVAEKTAEGYKRFL